MSLVLIMHMHALTDQSLCQCSYEKKMHVLTVCSIRHCGCVRFEAKQSKRDRPPSHPALDVFYPASYVYVNVPRYRSPSGGNPKTFFDDLLSTPREQGAYS